jgi:ribosomal protein S18 acetylase RimI-like enzyme
VLAVRETTVHLPNGSNYSVRPARLDDVPKVTRLIHGAFKVWKKQGLRLGPMFQDDAETKKHLAGKGFVAIDSKGTLRGTFSLEHGSVRWRGKTKLAFDEGGSVVDYDRTGGWMRLAGGRFLIFKKAAVDPRDAHAGLGASLYTLAETLGRENGYDGMLLETVAEAAWLYDWYVRLGFKKIGVHRYPGSPLDTILMIKPFHR